MKNGVWKEVSFSDENNFITNETFLVNSGVVLSAALLLALFFPLCLILMKVMDKTSATYAGAIVKSFHWGFILRFLQSNFLLLGHAALLSTYHTTFATPFDGISTVFGYLFLILVHAYLIFVPAFTWLNRGKLMERDVNGSHSFRATWGVIVDDLSGPSLFHFGFLLRRLVLFYTLVFLDDYGLAQILINLFFAVVLFTYQMVARPFYGFTRSLIWGIVEGEMLIISVFMLLFIPDTDLGENADKFMICLIIFFLLTQMVLVPLDLFSGYLERNPQYKRVLLAAEESTEQNGSVERVKQAAK